VLLPSRQLNPFLSDQGLLVPRKVVLKPISLKILVVVINELIEAGLHVAPYSFFTIVYTRHKKGLPERELPGFIILWDTLKKSGTNPCNELEWRSKLFNKVRL